MTAPTLTTERLTLRHHRLDDFDAYAAAFAAPDAKFMGGPLDRQDAWYAFCSDVAAWDLLGFGAWAMDLTETGDAVGQICLNQLPSYPEREMGWLTFGPHRGQGYATEGARAVRAYIFDTLGWDSVVSYIDPPNAASIKVAEHLGATRDDTAARPDPGDLVYRHMREARQ